jgi:23S rRNA (adenine2030-N6)-methyltransferase
MLSYKHGFHAGNYADVLKHAALLLVLERLAEKDKPYCVIDGHAGRGLYDLSSEEAQKTGEWREGIAMVSSATPRSQGLSLLAAAVGQQAPHTYPGSIALARAALRADDRLIGLELHPNEFDALKKWAGRDARVAVHRRDTLEGLPALVPPAIRRGLVLVDPPYELKTDYDKIPAMLIRCVRRWATGVYALWYPILPEGRQVAMIDLLAKRLGPSHGVVVVETSGRPGARGMTGSGLVLINPPFRIEESMAELCAEIVGLGIGDLRQWRVERVGGPYAGKRLHSGSRAG